MPRSTEPAALPEDGAAELRLAEELITELGSIRRQLQQINAQKMAKIARVEAEDAKASKKLLGRESTILRKLARLDAQFGDRMFQKRKHIDLRGGHVLGRREVDEVEISGNPELVAKRLLRMGLRHLVTEHYTLVPDKQAIKKKENLWAVGKIRGLRIRRQRTVYVVPAGLKEIKVSRRPIK